jgi:hypothetical protein
MRINPKHNDPDDPKPTPPARNGRALHVELAEPPNPMVALNEVEWHEQAAEARFDRAKRLRWLADSEDIVAEFHVNAARLCKRMAFGPGLAA